MLQKLRQQNLTPHGGQLEKKSYGIVQEGSPEGKNINTFIVHYFFKASNYCILFMCSKLTMILGEGTSPQTYNTSPVGTSTVAPQKKMTPKRKPHIG